MNKPSVLVIEDDRRYQELSRLNLAGRGYRVLLASDGISGLNLLESESVDLVILDVLLPGMNGFEVCKRIREFSTVPIIMLTAKAEPASKVHGLRLGADDYVTKPFGPDELMARVEAVLRRSKAAEAVAPAPFVSGDLTVDFEQRRLVKRGADVALTRAEYKLLHHLALNVGRVLVQDDLLRRVWGVGYEDQVELLHTTIHRLRMKIEDDPSSPRHVITKRGIGYMLAAPAFVA